MNSDDPSRPPFKILIIDDEPSIVHVLARTLLGLGALRFAVRGEDALRVLKEDPQDLVLTDADMPDISGFEIIERMRKDPRMVQTPVIMVTGHAAPQIRQHAKDLGVAEFMVKPIDREQLRTVVQRLLGLPATPPSAPVAAPAPAPVPAPTPAPAVPTSSSAPSPGPGAGTASALLDRIAEILEAIDTVRDGAPPDAARLGAVVSRIEDACGDMTRLLVQLNDQLEQRR